MSSRFVLAAALLIFSAAAQVPSTVAKITNLDTSSGTPQLEYQNTGSKAITAIVIRNITPTPHKGEVVMAQYPDAMLEPGQSGRLQIWTGLDPDKLGSEVEIAAVIFDDGTRLGSAPDPAYNGVDAVDELLEGRRGAADELAKWAKLVQALPKDDRSAVQQFVQAAAALKPGREVHTQYDLGVTEIQAGMRATAERIQAALAKGTPPRSVRAQYLSHIPEHAAATAKFAKGATQ